MRLKRPISRRSEIGDKVEIDPDRDRVRVGDCWLVCGPVELDFSSRTRELVLTHQPAQLQIALSFNKPRIQWLSRAQASV